MLELHSRLLRTALVAVALVAVPAQAGPDTYGTGTGRDGALTASTLGTVVNFYSQLTAPAAPGDTTLVVSSTANFSSGALVLVLQMTGVVPEPSSGGPSPVDLTNDPVGRWELARLTGVGGSSMTLDQPLVNSYAANVTQIIRVPEYTTVTVTSSGFITAPAWNGNTGGVVAFLANSTVSLNRSPSVDVTGKGFRGGTSVDDLSAAGGCTLLDEPAVTGAQKGEGIAATRFGPAQTGRGRVGNGGGGGVCYLSGGGGGGNGGAGGQGGNSEVSDLNRGVGGQGGAALTFSNINHLVMGGGGGAGHVEAAGSGTVSGGAGGGIIFIRADAMSGSGSQVAHGGSGGPTTGQDAASGGGAGGTIYLRIANGATCGSLQAVGGIGGNANGGFDVGPGGGGGGGRILLQKGSGTCTVTASSIVGGNAGVQQNSSAPGGSQYGAQAGSSGSVTNLASGFPASMLVPVVTTPANGSRTNNNKPPYTGTLSTAAATGSQVAISIDGSEVARVNADASGNWTFTPTLALPEGSHTISAISVNTAQAVQSTKSNTNTFTIDTTPPAAPVVVTPANGSVTNNNKPLYSGTAESNATVTVIVDGSPVGTATANASGNWSFTQPTSLADGSHTLWSTATDVAGNTSSNSNTNAFTVDTTPPAAPVVVTPANGALTNNNRPTHSGTAESNATVSVIVDGVSIGTTTADASGNWSLTPIAPLADGAHTTRATATDTAGNTSVSSNTNTFTVDTTPPVAPVVVAPANGSSTNNTTPVYSGTAEAGGTVQVLVDGTVIGTATANGVGAWSLTQPTPLSESAHSVKARATDAAGNSSPDSNTNTFTVDATPPAAPVVSLPSNGAIGNGNRPVYSGTAEAGSTVTVFVDSGAVGTTTATAGGNWSLTQPTALADGSHTVKATATDAVGNVSAQSNTNTFTVDTTPPAAPVVVTPANGGVTNSTQPAYSGTAEANSTVTVVVDGNPAGSTSADASGNWIFAQPTPLPEGAHSVKAKATDVAGNTGPDSSTNTFTVDVTPPAAPVLVSPANGSRTNDNTPLYAGTAVPLTTVTVIVDGSSVGSTSADGSGNWMLTQPTALGEGPHSVKATARDAAMNVSPDSNTSAFEVDTVAPSAPVVSAPANGSVLSSAQPTYSGTAEAGSTVAVIVDNVSVGTATAAMNGGWSLMQPTALAEGAHSVKATATDAAGNVSAASSTVSFDVDSVAPAAPFISEPADGAVVSSVQPTYSGTAEAGTTVTVIVDGAVLGTTTASGIGEWSYMQTTPLAEGAHTVKARAADGAGHVSADSNAVTFTVDAGAPAVPVVTSPANGSATNNNRVTYSGTAEPGTLVTVFVDEADIGSAVASASGAWSVMDLSSLEDGVHSVYATASDSVGNQSASSAKVEFTVDTVAPETSIVSGPEGSANGSSAAFELSSNEAGATFECNLDGAGFGACTATPTFEGLAEGEHSLLVRARDTAGNVDASPESRSWTVASLSLRGGAPDSGVGCSCGSADPVSLSVVGLALSAVFARRRRRK